jgi:hypothetical protein
VPGDQDHHHHGRGGRRSSRDYVDDFFRNWSTYEGSLAEKLRLTLVNRARAARPPFRGCCGNRGQPGC